MAVVGGTWTFSGDPASSDKDAVRFLIRDVDSRDQMFSDQEIDYALGLKGSQLGAAAMLCDMAATSGDLTDKQVGDLKISGSQRASQYRALADPLRRQVSYGVGIYAGGISYSDKEKYESDPDVNQPAFYRGEFDYPLTNQDGDGQPSSTQSGVGYNSYLRNA